MRLVNKMNNKGVFQISFPWIFAIIVGVFILFLAIYGVSKLISVEETVQGAKTSKEIGILLNPLETGFEQAKTTLITFPVETRIFNKCSLEGNFGVQLIQISQKSFNKWTKTDIDVGFYNKYIFSKDIAEGIEMFVFTKPFEMPFKISDLTYIISSNEKYCFTDAPEDIEEELLNLGQENIVVNCSEEEQESKNAIRVCFSEEDNCDVVVNYGMKYVEKRDGKVYFEGDALMYAGIFSEKEIYECQLKRLMKRLEVLGVIYKEKVNVMECGEGLLEDLTLLINSAKSLESSSNLKTIEFNAQEAEKENSQSICRLW